MRRRYPMSGPLLDAARAALGAATGRPLAEALIRDLPDTVDPAGTDETFA
jgi:hypothetical protein